MRISGSVSKRKVFAPAIKVHCTSVRSKTELRLQQTLRRCSDTAVLHSAVRTKSSLCPKLIVLQNTPRQTTGEVSGRKQRDSFDVLLKAAWCAGFRLMLLEFGFRVQGFRCCYLDVNVLQGCVGCFCFKLGMDPAFSIGKFPSCLEQSGH